MDDAPPSAPSVRDLVEIMTFDPMAGILELEDALMRLKAGAAACGTPFDRHAVRNELQAATFRLREARTIRLLVGPTGALAIEVSPADVAVAKGSLSTL